MLALLDVFGFFVDLGRRPFSRSLCAGLIATAAGKVHFVDFIQQKEVYTLSLPNAVIDSLDIVVTDSYKVFYNLSLS